MLARVLFPRIATLDSSCTPQRTKRADMRPRTLAAVDLEGIRVALGADTANLRRNGRALPSFSASIDHCTKHFFRAVAAAVPYRVLLPDWRIDRLLTRRLSPRRVASRTS